MAEPNIIFYLNYCNSCRNEFVSRGSALSESCPLCGSNNTGNEYAGVTPLFSQKIGETP